MYLITLFLIFGFSSSPHIAVLKSQHQDKYFEQDSEAQQEWNIWGVCVCVCMREGERDGGVGMVLEADWSLEFCFMYFFNVCY